MTVCLEQVSDKQLSLYAALIYERTGISISPQKKTLLSNRVRRRLRATEIADFDAYFGHLKGLKSDHAEWDAFLQEITTHETFLFRDEGHWNWLRDSFIPEMASLARAGKRGKSLRIWSAACSTGDEAYTIATCLAGHLPKYSEWKIEILGTDIGMGALEEARAGIFGERAMKLVPKDLNRKFFTPSSNGKTWNANSVLTRMTKFRQHNLLDPLNEAPFDLIFLKNVLIYFDATSKATVAKHVGRVLRPGGMLVTAAAEGVSDLLHGMEKRKPWLHQKSSETTGAPRKREINDE